MPHYELEYHKDKANTVKRYPPRASYGLETIHGIVNSSTLLHVSFNDPAVPFPAVLPMIGQMGSFERPSAGLDDPLELYLHGYVSSRIMNLARAAAAAAGAGVGDEVGAGGAEGAGGARRGLPVTVAATHLDGLVLALTPMHHSCNYRSAVLFGYATVVEDEAERLWAMELMTDSVVPARWKNTRVPPTGAELQSTSVLRVEIVSGSAKIRIGPPSDDRHDLENDEVTGRVWSGVIPTYTALGDPAPGPKNRAELPASLAEFVRDQNQTNRAEAIESMKELATSG